MVDADGYATAYTAFATGDATYADVWPQVAQPALFLTGALDANSTPAMARQMAAAAPRGRAVVIEGHGHMAPMTAPAAVNDALRTWLAEEVQQ
jgi:pimeloyl-ACP methyl ester carboxylesterase